MYPDQATEFYRTALLRVLATLFTVAGIGQGWSTVFGTPVATLPRHLHCRVLRLLRPAESAARRLIVVAAERLSVELKPLRPRKKPEPPKPAWMLTGPARAPGQRVRSEAEAEAAAKLEAARKHIPAFPVFDKRKCFNLTQRPRRRSARSFPQITFFGRTDERISPPPLPSPDDPMDAERLCKRLASLQRALSDIPAQAQRLARMAARREAAGSWLAKPMRPGLPPGNRTRRKHEVDGILIECHRLALGIWEPERSLSERYRL